MQVHYSPITTRNSPTKHIFEQLMVLRIENLTFGWQKEPLFENISCQFFPNDIIQLSGENGSVKTTLLHLISGLIPHFSRGELLTGDIFLNERSILKKPPKSFFPSIAFIPGINLDFFLLTESLRQEILLTSAILKTGENRVEKQLDEFSNFFPALKELMDMPFKQMQINQKIVALTFIYYLQNAQIYLFDEVMTTFSESKIQQWYSFFEWLSSYGCTTIFVNHHQQAEQFSQWILKDEKLTPQDQE